MVDQPRAVYQQITDDLRDRLRNGWRARGEVIPSEPELAAEYGVSRATINRAVLALRDEGLVEVRRGVGTIATADNTRLTLRLPSDLADTIAAAATDAGVIVHDWIVEACRMRLSAPRR